MSESRGWIGVDLDGTLAYDSPAAEWGGIEKIGEPIPAMVERIKKWLADGEDVRILTARVNPIHTPLAEVAAFSVALEKWCTAQFGRGLRFTHAKDYDMRELWDDRAVQVIRNTGVAVVDKLKFAEEVIDLMAGHLSKGETVDASAVAMAYKDFTQGRTV